MASNTVTSSGFPPRTKEKKMEDKHHVSVLLLLRELRIAKKLFLYVNHICFKSLFIFISSSHLPFDHDLLWCTV